MLDTMSFFCFQQQLNKTWHIKFFDFYEYFWGYKLL